MTVVEHRNAMNVRGMAADALLRMARKVAKNKAQIDRLKEIAADYPEVAIGRTRRQTAARLE